MGKAGRASFEHSADCTCTSGQFPQRIGWEQFTDAAIRILDQEDRPIVFLLWGGLLR